MCQGETVRLIGVNGAETGFGAEIELPCLITHTEAMVRVASTCDSRQSVTLRVSSTGGRDATVVNANGATMAIQKPQRRGGSVGTTHIEPSPALEKMTKIQIAKR